MNVAIFGLGAIGSLVSSQLLDTCQVYYYSRTKKNRVYIKTFDGIVNDEIFDAQWDAENIDFDFIIICVKEHHTVNILHNVKTKIGDKTIVAIVRNGLHLAKPFEQFIPNDRIVPVIINCSVEPDARGCYVQKSSGVMKIPKSQNSKLFKDIFKKSVLEIDCIEDFHSASWVKMIESTAIGGLTCVEGKPLGELKTKYHLEILKGLISEGIAVAKADGAKIDRSLNENLIEKILAYPDDKGSSMLTDRKLGRKIELGAKNGCIVALGKQYNIATPQHQRVIEKLKSL